MTAAAACAVDDAAQLLALELGAAALSAEALGSSPDYYDPAIQAAKHHPGQAAVAAALRALLAGSRLAVPHAEIRRRMEGCAQQAQQLRAAVQADVCIQR